MHIYSKEHMSAAKLHLYAPDYDTASLGQSFQYNIIYSIILFNIETLQAGNDTNVVYYDMIL